MVLLLVEEQGVHLDLNPYLMLVGVLEDIENLQVLHQVVIQLLL